MVIGLNCCDDPTNNLVYYELILHYNIVHGIYSMVLCCMELCYWVHVRNFSYNVAKNGRITNESID